MTLHAYLRTLVALVAICAMIPVGGWSRRVDAWIDDWAETIDEWSRQ